jgi:hypothetical protein
VDAGTAAAGSGLRARRADAVVLAAEGNLRRAELAMERVVSSSVFRGAQRAALLATLADVPRRRGRVRVAREAIADARALLAAARDAGRVPECLDAVDYDDA